MRLLSFLLLGLVATTALSTTTTTTPSTFDNENPSSSPLFPLFRAWMEHHNISIPKAHFAHRLSVFAANHAFILAHNAQLHPRPSYTLGHNRFSHLTFEEFRAMHLGWTRPTEAVPPSFQPAFNDDMITTTTSTASRALRGSIDLANDTKNEDTNSVVGQHFPSYIFPLPPWIPPPDPSAPTDDPPPPSSLPASVDWVSKGAVTPVKDQGSCGSCYSFSAVGAVEGAYFLTNGELLELSMQEIVDCDDLDGGCQGGEMQQTFKWINGNGGLCLLSDYPYVSGTTAEEQKVCSTCPVVPGTAPESWTTVRRNSMEGLKEAVAGGPVSVAVGASRAWMFYESGVFDGACEGELNHGVLCVGYGGEEAGEYWKVKNSWGTGWGMDGYILLKRDDGDKEAACGILQDASYPILPQPSASSSISSLSALPAAVATLVEEKADNSSKEWTAFTSPTQVQGSATARDCGGGTAVFTSINIIPSSIEKNQLVTVLAEGVLTKPTLSGSYYLSVIYEGAQLYAHSGSACGNETVSLPLNAGIVHVFGFACPVNPGPVEYGLDVTLPSIAPFGGYLISIKGKDQDGADLVCIEAELQL